MTQGQIHLARILAYGGILPPWLALILHVSTGLPWAGFAALTYGAVIASFVCGMHWGIAMQPSQRMPVNLLITSNVGALAAWAMLLASMWSTDLAFLGLAIVLGVLLLVDRKLLSATIIEPWLWSVRCIASIGLGAGLMFWSILA